MARLHWLTICARRLPICKNPLQPRNDLLEVVYRYAAPLLGEMVAEQAAQELQTLPAVLTAQSSWC